MVPWPKPPEQVITAPAWGCDGGRTRKSEIGARLVMMDWLGWRVGLSVRVRESAKWEPRKMVEESSATRAEGMEDYVKQVRMKRCSGKR